MFDSTRSLDLLVTYLEALGVASGARARRRAIQILNECRARTAGEDITPAELLRRAREQALVADSLSARSLPPELPTRMPPQAFRYSAWRGGGDVPFHIHRGHESGGAAEASGR